jgi:hypothetical protein
MASLEAALATIPNLPRPLLCRLTDRMIERLDELDGDVDLESDEIRRMLARRSVKKVSAFFESGNMED